MLGGSQPSLEQFFDATRLANSMQLTQFSFFSLSIEFKSSFLNFLNKITPAIKLSPAPTVSFV